MAWYHVLPFTGLSRRSRGVLYGNIAHVLEAGIPVLRGMQILEEQAHNRRFRSIFKRMKEHIDQGGSIGSALASMPEYIPEAEARIIASTETTGTTPLTFQRLSEYLIWFSDIVRSVVFQSFYPMFLLLFAFIGIPVIHAVVLGGIENLLHILMWQTIHTLLMFLLVYIGWKVLMTLPGIRYLFHHLLLYIPMIGSTVRQIARARFARTYECMIAASVPYFEGIRQSADSCGNLAVAKAIHKVIPAIEQGATVAQALKKTHLFTPISLGILEVGEESGKMDESLHRFAHEEEEKATLAIHAFGRMLPPLIFIIIAVIVVWTVILPGFQGYFNLLNSIQ